MTFLELKELCERPTREVMRTALEARRTLSGEEADFLTYLAGFTHYAEAADILGEFGLEFIQGTALLFDVHQNALHMKVLLNDLYHCIETFTAQHFSQKYGALTFRNNVAAKHRGGFLGNFSTFNHHFYLRLGALPAEEKPGFKTEFWSQFEPMLGEYVNSLTENAGEVDSPSLTIHFCRIPARNTGQNFPRLFCNVGAIAVINDGIDRHNTSLKHLREARECYQSFRVAKWIIVNVGKTQDVVDFVDEVGATYEMLPYKGETSDYISPLLTRLRGIVKSSIAVVSAGEEG
jgi:hypothetical protein